MEKALLSEKSYNLYKLLIKILQQVNMFTFKKENYFYQSALQEYERLQSNAMKSEDQLEDDDLQTKISINSIE